MNNASLTGAGGSIKWAYHVAAELGEWTLISGATGRVLSAAVTSSDAFRVTQAPLRFTVPMRRWAWPIESLQIVDGRLTARLGPQESL